MGIISSRPQNLLSQALPAHTQQSPLPPMTQTKPATEGESILDFGPWFVRGWNFKNGDKRDDDGETEERTDDPDEGEQKLEERNIEMPVPGGWTAGNGFERLGFSQSFGDEDMRRTRNPYREPHATTPLQSHIHLRRNTLRFSRTSLPSKFPPPPSPAHSQSSPPPQTNSLNGTLTFTIDTTLPSRIHIQSFVLPPGYSSTEYLYLEPSYEQLSPIYSPGLGQVVGVPIQLPIPKPDRNRNINTGTKRPESADGDTHCHPRATYALGIYLEAKTDTSEPESEMESTFVVITDQRHHGADRDGESDVKEPDKDEEHGNEDKGGFEVKAYRQEIRIDKITYTLQEIYGFTSDKDTEDPTSTDCVICMSEPKDVIVLPCYHLCLCKSCAEAVRMQGRAREIGGRGVPGVPRCPICRTVVQSLLRITIPEVFRPPHPVIIPQRTSSLLYKPTGEPRPSLPIPSLPSIISRIVRVDSQDRHSPLPTGQRRDVVPDTTESTVPINREPELELNARLDDMGESVGSIPGTVTVEKGDIEMGLVRV